MGCSALRSRQHEEKPFHAVLGHFVPPRFLQGGFTGSSLFLAEQSGGLAKIKAMSAPFPMFKVMPTGGISLKNLKEYLSCPVICACGGSYMVTADLIDGQKWDEITALCKQSADIVKEARSNG